MTEKREKWKDPRDPGYLAIYASSDGPEDMLENFRTMIENLPALPDRKIVQIICTDSSHDIHPLIYGYLVQYVRGNPEPPIFVRELYSQTDLVFIELIRNMPLAEISHFAKTGEFENGLTASAQAHLEKSGQWKEKVNLFCECGENIPIKNLSRFMELTKLALDEEIDDIPLIFFRIAKLPPINHDTP